MVSTSKILTVSYGTFSCTLEGFEDSFSTMQAIAEYFRDLAANDRYFGAEPPQPDAEMLAAIAARESTRRVAAHQDGTDIILKAEDSAAALIDADAASADAPADKPKKKKKKKKNKAKGSDKPKGKAKAVARRAAKAAAAAQADDTVALNALDMEPAEDAAASNVEADFAAEAQDETDVLSNVLAAPEAELAEISQDDLVEDAEQTAQRDIPHPDGDSVAAKLQRIRAVVTSEKEDSDFNEDQHANDLQEPFLATSDDLSDTFEMADDIYEDDAESLMSDDAEPMQETSELSENMDDDDFDLSAITASIAADAEPSLEDDAALDVSDDDDDLDLSKVLGDLNNDDAAIEDVTDVDAAEDDVEQEDIKPRRPRVVKMKRADFEKAVSDGTFEEEPETPSSLADLDGLDDIDDLVTDVSASGLSDEEEAALMADLADVEDLAQEEQFQESVSSEEKRRTLLETQDTDDAAMSRLMEKTDEHMEAPDNSRRRNAIAHLKAAVAAKEAARKMGEPDDSEEDGQNAFRNDLNDVVRPTRPRSSGGARASRPTPLKLVAAQRVDMIEPAKTDGPVIPRRISLDKIATEEPMISAASDASSFAEFAEDVGAHELQDLLEAAAAYTAFVEGKDVFSRPQVMNIVRSFQEDDFSREDGLRSFGTLLREGRIQKIKAGRFQISEDTRFRPEDRAAS